jgi:hypothetical protein
LWRVSSLLEPLLRVVLLQAVLCMEGEERFATPYSTR